MAPVWNLFHEATLVLVGCGPVKQRLVDAYRIHLASVREQDVPEQLRPRLVALRDALHAERATGGMTAPEASVRKMSEKDAAAHGAEILGVFSVLCAHESELATPRLRLVGGVEHDDAGEVPAFLSRA